MVRNGWFIKQFIINSIITNIFFFPWLYNLQSQNIYNVIFFNIPASGTNTQNTSISILLVSFMFVWQKYANMNLIQVNEHFVILKMNLPTWKLKFSEQLLTPAWICSWRRTEGGVVGFFFGRTPTFLLGEEGRFLGNVTLLEGTVILRAVFLTPKSTEKKKSYNSEYRWHDHKCMFEQGNKYTFYTLFIIMQYN